MNTSLLGLGEIAKKLNTNTNTVFYYLRKWGVQPTFTSGGRRFYLEAVIDVLGQMFEILRKIKKFKMPEDNSRREVYDENHQA